MKQKNICRVDMSKFSYQIKSFLICTEVYLQLAPSDTKLHAPLLTYRLADLHCHICRQSALFTSTIYPTVHSKSAHFLVRKLPVDGPQVRILPVVITCTVSRVRTIV